MNRADRAAFTLHFHDGGHGVPEIFFAFGRPLIAPLGDGGRRRDWVDRHRLVQAIGDVSGGLAAVNGFENRCFINDKSMVSC